MLVGSYEINNTGATNLATAENGLQINILGVNFFDRNYDSKEVAGTMVHEFVHILDGTRAVPSTFKAISETDYLGSGWTSNLSNYLEQGFLSPYARSNAAEDVAVLLGSYVCDNEEWWQGMLAAAGEEGAAKLLEKISILKAWMRDSFNVDVEKWREVFVKRFSELDQIDWDNLDE